VATGIRRRRNTPEKALVSGDWGLALAVGVVVATAIAVGTGVGS
jgi:hypothetical protein